MSFSEILFNVPLFDYLNGCNGGLWADSIASAVSSCAPVRQDGNTCASCFLLVREAEDATMPAHFLL